MSKQQPRRSRLAPLAVIGALIALALLLFRCGPRLGLGGDDGDDPDPGAARTVAAPIADAAPARCQVRLAAAGLSVDGRTVEPAAAIEACRAAGAADVIVTGDARQGDWDALRAGLEGAGVELFVRGGGVAADAGP